MELRKSDISEKIYSELQDIRKRLDRIETEMVSIQDSSCTPYTIICPEAGGKYKYQDNQDKKIDLLKENFSAWERSERRILNRIRKHIAVHTTNNKLILLDAGCGQGRLLPIFEQYFESVTAVEPDEDRFYAAKALVEAKGFRRKVDFRNSKIQHIEDSKKYDVIICSHVLQHVSTQSFSEIIMKFKSILKESGLLFLTISHSTIEHEYFEIVYTNCIEDTWDIVSKEQFDQAEAMEGVLPVRHFTIDDIKQYLNGFDIIDYRVFHVYPTLSLVERVVNRFATLQSMHGIDMFVAAKLVNAND